MPPWTAQRPISPLAAHKAVAPCSHSGPQPRQQTPLAVPHPERGPIPGHRRGRGHVGPSPSLTCRRRRLGAENATREPEQHVRTQEFGSAFYPLSALDPPRRWSRAPHHLTSAPGLLCQAHTYIWDRADLAAAPERCHSPSTIDRGYIWDMQATAGKVCCGPVSGGTAAKSQALSRFRFLGTLMLN